MRSMEPSEEERTSVSFWSDVHKHLDLFYASVEKGFAATPEEKQRILKARAKMLAKESKEEESTQSVELAQFLLASETYGIESRHIREVYPMKELTTLPCTPPFVLGIVNVRGQILSVIDIKKFFDLPQKGLTDLNKVIIVHTDPMEVGILADAILGMRSVPLAEIQPPLPTWTGIRAEYLKGVTNQRLVVLDIERILSDRRIIVHQEVDP